MKIFVAGATGVIGSRLVPLLVDGGHEVVGLSRRPEGAKRLEELGARGVVCDVYDRETLHGLLDLEGPEIVVHELTDFSRELGPSGSEAEFAPNQRCAPRPRATSSMRRAPPARAASWPRATRTSTRPRAVGSRARATP
jgi:uncharacterized protein YbjT (DUF2867 family)